MRRLVLPAFFALTMVVTTLSAGAFGASQSQLALSERFPLPVRSVAATDTEEEQQGARDSQDHGAAELQRQVSDLQALVAQVKQQLAQRKARSPGTGQQAAGDASQHDTADLQRQDAELHNELQGLITQLDQELQFEVQTPPASDPVEQQRRQTARDALKHSIADLQQQDSELQALIAQPGQAIAQNEQKPPAPDVGGELAAQDALQHQSADLQHQIADLRQQDDALQGQLAKHRQELAQSEQELAQRRHDIDGARAEADKLHQDIDSLRQQRQAAEAWLAQLRTQRRMEEASQAQQKTQQQATATEAPRPAASKPAPQPTRLPPARQQAQAAPAPQPAQPTPPPAAPQQLQTAQQWLSAGRPDEARRLLAVVQTQVVFQPATPGTPDAQGQDNTVTDVGDAIRWLDMGAGDQAMQSIKRAINDANSRTTNTQNRESAKQNTSAGR